jgi:hypothetical protein
VLKPGARGLLTAFLFSPPHGAEAFPFSDSAGAVRWKVRHRPEAAIAFDRTLFESMVADGGLVLDWIEPGFWPGTATSLQAQDLIFVRRAPNGETAR